MKTATITEENVNEMLPMFGSVFVAVFNCRTYGRTLGRRAVIEKFGVEAWNNVKKKMKTGIMEIFHHMPTPETILYIETVAMDADKYHSVIAKAKEQAED